MLAPSSMAQNVPGFPPCFRLSSTRTSLLLRGIGAIMKSRSLAIAFAGLVVIVVAVASGPVHATSLSQTSGVDLGLAAWSVTSAHVSRCPGYAPTFIASIHNYGDAPTGGFKVRWIIDQQIVDQDVGSLGPGDSTQVSFRWTNVSNGEHVLVIIIDPDRRTADSDRGNNVLATIYSPGCDVQPAPPSPKVNATATTSPAR